MSVSRKWPDWPAHVTGDKAVMLYAFGDFVVAVAKWFVSFYAKPKIQAHARSLIS